MREERRTIAGCAEGRGRERGHWWAGEQPGAARELQDPLSANGQRKAAREGPRDKVHQGESEGRAQE